ncbi:hypothetical protein Tco_1453184 [Tanacetum coccineum]
MHDDVQPNYVVDSHAGYTSDSNMILYAEYVKDNAIPVVQSNVSSVPNDAYMMIINEMHEQTAQSVYANEQNKALTKEIKEMKEIFEELEAEVDQNVVNIKWIKAEQKNLLITNGNLTADCLSKEMFYTTTNSELTVSRFTYMHDAHTVIQARCLELKAELSKLRDNV